MSYGRVHNDVCECVCVCVGRDARKNTKTWSEILCSVDRASLYNLVNETSLVHKILSIFRQFYL